MTKLKTISLSALSVAAAIALAACGGGGDSGSTNSGSTGNNPNPSNPPSTSVPGTVDTPQYAAGSAQLAAMSLLNQYRTQCGFPALKQNTVLDQASQAHAQYMGLNNGVTDSEVSGSQGFTGATYADRATHFGFPSSAIGAGVSGGFAVTSNGFSQSIAGTGFVNSLVAGVYHLSAVMYPTELAGFGEYETQSVVQGTTVTTAWQSISLRNTSTVQLASSPLTFPCQGVTGVPYASRGETPTPPNVSGMWGTPIAVVGNITDTVSLSTATLTSGSGQIALQVLNATTDPNKLVQQNTAVAYSTSPLSPSTQYSATLTGTVNGQPFSRNFTFTTGSSAG
ncbi:CAP domain-containing protein [Burkholderia cenocepacia]|uniref:CAP domain-containing protein n=1 Tax=Burkholderia cenocepacia TaxID=95486 RepID=UPI001B99B3C1|nr:CAP domain-containing protein [Burkholderia cenocepacia]MBR8270445.1 CAP domain-containing protein [Burkholderia cenocepacia]